MHTRQQCRVVPLLRKMHSARRCRVLIYEMRELVRAATMMLLTMLVGASYARHLTYARYFCHAAFFFRLLLLPPHDIAAVRPSPRVERRLMPPPRATPVFLPRAAV